MQLPAEFQKRSQKTITNASLNGCSANSSNLKKKKTGPGGGRRMIGIQAPLVMQPQSLTRPLSRAAPEKYADSSAHIAHHHLCGTSESRACIVSV